MIIISIVAILLLIILCALTFYYLVKPIPLSVPDDTSTITPIVSTGSPISTDTVPPSLPPSIVPSIAPSIAPPIQSQPQPPIQRSQRPQPPIQRSQQPQPPGSQPPQPPGSQPPQPPIGDANSQENCLKLHNEVRARQGMPPLVSGTADEIACANRVAQANFLAKKAHSQTCMGSQNECPATAPGSGFKSLEQCLAAYEKEGPSPGLSHYNNIKNAKTSVACGVYPVGSGTFYYSHQYK